MVLNVLAAQHRIRLASLLLAENRLAKLADLLSRLPADLPVFVAGQGVIDAIAGFHLHRGILGLGHRPLAVAPRTLLSAVRPDQPVIAAISIANHDNIGGIFRNAAAFGAGAVILDDGSVDPLYRKAIRVSVGGVLKVPFARAGDAAATIDALEAAGFTPLALSPSGEDDLENLRLPRRPALVFGAEGPGLPAAVLARARRVRISMRGDFDSLNVATASGIALYLATRGSTGSG